MKFCASILALCALSTADAFSTQHRTFTRGNALNADKYSYLGDMNGDRSRPNQRQNMPPPPMAGGRPQAGVMAPADRRAMGMDDTKVRRSGDRKTAKECFEEVEPVQVQGGSLRTCSFNESVNRVSVFLKTEGRPLNANVELWQGPDNSPQKMSVYLEDGAQRPFCATLESPGSSNSVAIRNTGQMEFPLTAGLAVDMSPSDMGPSSEFSRGELRTVQGGAVYTTPFAPSVQAVQIMLRSDGRPLNARVELLQGPNNNKQVVEVYSEDGALRPFYSIIDTPGSGNVVRIVNTATVEFPLSAAVKPYVVEECAIGEGGPMAGGMMWS